MALGRKTGGRTAGTPNRKTAEVQAKIEKAGVTPLQFMVEVLQDENQSFQNRQWAAREAAPYLHPKLSSTDVQVKGSLKIDMVKRMIVDPKE